MPNPEAQQIDSAIAKSEPLAKSLIAWRLFDSPLIHAHGSRLLGTVLRDLGFIDLTHLVDVAKKYARGDFPVLAEVRLPAGTKVLPMLRTIGSKEGDLLVARGSCFVVRRASPANDAGVAFITLELIA